jgi:hypothetical protein
MRCTPEVRQKIYPTDVIVDSEPFGVSELSFLSQLA